MQYETKNTHKIHRDKHLTRYDKYECMYINVIFYALYLFLKLLQHNVAYALNMILSQNRN